MAKCENENKASLVVSYIYLVYMLMDWRENPGWGASRSSCSDLDGLDLICYSMKAKADGASDWLALELGEKPLARTRGHGHVFRVWCSKLTQLSPSIVSDSLQPHELQHARPPSPSLTPRACSNSCPLSRWCHPTISSSVIPFSCLQSFSASGSFQMSQFFASGGQTIGVFQLQHQSFQWIFRT